MTFYLPPNGKQFGPYKLRREPGAESEIDRRLNDLLEHPPQRFGETAWWIEPPKISYDNYILVLVRHSYEVDAWSAVYVVPMSTDRETMSLEKIQSYVNLVYGPNAVDGVSLRGLNKSNEGEGRTGLE